MSAHFRWTLPERNSDATVQAFRSEMLDGNLLQRDEVAGWVAQKAMDDRRLAPHQPPVYDQNFLYYAEPNRIEKFLPTISNTKGVLSRLRCLSESLAKRYDWQLPQATLFVLTGKAPGVPLIDHSVGGTRTISFSKSGLRLTDTPRTISVKYDPRFVGKEELVKYVSALSLKRPRPLEKRTLKRMLIGKGPRKVSKKLSAKQLLREMETVFSILGAHRVVESKTPLPETSPGQPPTLDRRQVQKKLHIGRATFYRLIDTGQLSKPAARRWHARWALEEVERVAQERKKRRP